MKKFFLSLILATCGVYAASGNVGSLVHRGDIVTTSYQDNAAAGRYIGNGRFGTVIGPLGMNLSPEEQASRRTGASHISHINHWGRFNFVSAIEKTPTSADYNLPIMKIHWDGNMDGISGYSQVQDFYDGVVSTDFTTSEGTKVHTEAWFDYSHKDIACFRFNVRGGRLAVKTTTISDFQAYPFVFRDTVRQETHIEKYGSGSYKVTVSCPQAGNNCESVLFFRTNASVEECSDGLRFLLPEGKSEICISYGKEVTPGDRLFSQIRSRRAWHKCWSDTGWMSFPDEDAQKVWVRSMAYMLESLDDFEYGLIQPDNGFTGNPFPFHFVQDLEYIAPALMMTGHNDIVMKWVEHFAGEIDNMKAYAKKLWPCSEGIYPPWELPFGSVDGYHEPTVPVAFCYEPHNSGYLARLAKESADFAGDSGWARRYAYPLIREVCEFYRSAARKQDDGLWHMSWYPCIGQDEAGGRNKTDYLCSIYSAEYSFKAAVDLGLDSDGAYAAILRDGLAYAALEDTERGTLHTCMGVDDFGRQKHPVQLDGLAYFPIQDAPLPYEAKAYSLRHDITQDARAPKFYGWTLGQFLLSGSNIMDSAGWVEDWDSIILSDYADPELIQIYETSGNPLQSFYITTHGMVEQSLIRNYVNDYWGELDIAGCPVFEGKVSFGNIYTRLGVKVSGSVEAGKADLEIKATKDCNFRMMGKQYSMKRGETLHLRPDKASGKDFCIAYPKCMSDTLAVALDDLEQYITTSIPGANVSIVADGSMLQPAGHLISFSAPGKDLEGKWNSFRISTTSRNDFQDFLEYKLEASDIMGYQYAVYDLAEKLLGVRYLKPDYDHIPVHKNFTAAIIDTGIQSPDYKWRGLYPWHYNYNSRGLYTFCDINAHFVKGDWEWFRSLCDWMVKNKQNAVLWFDDVFAHENISGQFPDSVSDYYAKRGIRQILGMGWASNEDLTVGGEWKRKYCLDKEGKSVEKDGWRRSICPMCDEYFQLCDSCFSRMKLDHPENYIGALIGYGENTWAAWEKGVECVEHNGVPSSQLILRDMNYVRDKLDKAGLGSLPLGFVTSTHSIHPGTPFETDNFINNVPSNTIFTMHTYQQSAWTLFQRLYDKIAERNDRDGNLKVFHIAETDFLCGADIPLVKPSILRRRSEHFNTLPRENTIGHMTTLNTTQYTYWYDVYQLMKWQWHKDNRNWEEFNKENYADIFGRNAGEKLNEIYNRLCCLEYVLSYDQLDSLRNTTPDLKPPKAWGRYNSATHSDKFGFLMWTDGESLQKLTDAQKSIEAVLSLNEELEAEAGQFYRDEFYHAIRLSAEYYGIRVACGLDMEEEAVRYLRDYDEDLARLKKNNPIFDGIGRDSNADFVFNPSEEYLHKMFAN